MQIDDVKRVMQEADLLVSPERLQKAIDKMAAEITAELKDSMPVVLSVMNGGLILAGQLLPKLSFPLEMGYLHASRYGEAVNGTQLQWLVPPPKHIAGRAVLLVDDILDEGVTLEAIVATCVEIGAVCVLTAVLLDKQHDRKVMPGYKADFTGIEIPDRFVFGYGLDYKGFWRNAQGIYAVKGL